MAPKTPLILGLVFLLCYKHWIDGVNCDNSKIHSGVDSGETINGNQTALQKHASFFDRNHDGIIYPWETYQGFRAIGAGFSLSSFAAVFINVALSPITRPGKPPSPQFPIEIKNIHRGKHGSDTGVYDTQGRFVEAKFEEIFQKHAHSNPTSLTSDELTAMLTANRIPNDNQGWVAAATEWKILYYLCKDKNGLLQKETIRAVYDGSLFEKMEKEQLKKQNK